MTHIGKPPEFHVTAETRLGDLQEFIQGAGSGRLVGDVRDKAIVLYVKPDTKPTLWERFKQLFSRRQDGHVREAIRNVFLRSLPSTLDPRKTEFLRANVAAGKNGLALTSLRGDLRVHEALTTDKAVGADDRFDVMERFAYQKGDNVGGKTGSVRVKTEGTNFQLKYDISRADVVRQHLERDLNVQNLGEVIGSAVLRAEFAAAAPNAEGTTPKNPANHARRAPTFFQGSDVSPTLPDVFEIGIQRSTDMDTRATQTFEQMERDDIKPDPPLTLSSEPPSLASAPTAPQLAPKVTLLDSAKLAEIAVVSEYLPKGQGDLEKYFTGTLDGTLRKGHHVKVVVGSAHAPSGQATIVPDPTKPETVHLQGQAVTDLADHLANAAWLQDHDFNPGSLIVLEGGRLGRIDYAHMGGNLMHGRYGSEAQFREKQFHGDSGSGGQNAIVDFINQKSLRGKSYQSTGGLSKVWRDYANLVPSLAFAHALQRLAARGDRHREGLLPAMEQMLSLVQHLESEPSENNQKKLENLVKSVAQISAHMGRHIDREGLDSSEVIVRAFNNMGEVLTERRREAAFAGDFCELQASINAHFRPQPGGPEVTREELDTLRQRFEQRHADKLKTMQPLVWFAESAEAPPFKGSIDAFIALRERQAREASPQAH